MGSLKDATELLKAMVRGSIKGNAGMVLETTASGAKRWMQLGGKTKPPDFTKIRPDPSEVSSPAPKLHKNPQPPLSFNEHLRKLKSGLRSMDEAAAEATAQAMLDKLSVLRFKSFQAIHSTVREIMGDVAETHVIDKGEGFLEIHVRHKSNKYIVFRTRLTPQGQIVDPVIVYYGPIKDWKQLENA